MIKYIVSIDNAKLGVKGTITFQSVHGPISVYTPRDSRKYTNWFIVGTSTLPVRLRRSWTGSRDSPNNRLGKCSP
jgi:hypothetical protein